MSISYDGTTLTFNDASTQTTASNVYYATGTAAFFQQTSAPTGWTKSTALNDYTIRVVSGTASTGGSTAFSTVMANQTPTINSAGLSASAVTLSSAQLPSHTHSYVYVANVGYSMCSGCFYGFIGRTSAAQGGGTSHTHSVSGSLTSSAVTLNVAYVDLIIATKN